MFAVLPTSLVLSMNDFRGIAESGDHLPLTSTLRYRIGPFCDLPADLVCRLAGISKFNRFERS